MYMYICIKILVGANINCLETKNKDGLTPLHIAARCGTVKYVVVINNQFHCLTTTTTHVAQDGY